jgi:dTMP kinase
MQDKDAPVSDVPAVLAEAAGPLDRTGASALFITFEGGEGAGKSTQIARLARRIAALGREVVTTREPGGSPKAETIRAFLLSGGARSFGPLAETMLFAAARADHVALTIRPALARGAVVLCDRFADSTRVYQGLLGEIPAETIRALDRIAFGETRPHLTLVFDLPAELGLARAQTRRRLRNEAVDRFEAEDLAFHANVRKGFLDIAHSEPERCALVDASGSADDVEATAWGVLAARFFAEGEREALMGAAGVH